MDFEKLSKENPEVQHIGRWMGNNEIPLYRIDGEVYALYGWNGVDCGNCWKCTGEFNLDASEEEYTITPIYLWERCGINLDGMSESEIDENEDVLFRCVDFKVSQN